MKTKLTLKILLVVLCVSLIPILFYGVSTSKLTLRRFNRYLQEEKGARQEALAELVADAYKEQGWDFIYYLRPESFLVRGRRGMMMHGAVVEQERVVILDSKGNIRYDSYTIKTEITKEELLFKTPIEVYGETIGFVLIVTPETGRIATLRAAFNNSLIRVTVISGLFASLFALAFGLLLSYDLIKRIKLLKKATDELSKGDLSVVVPVIGDDELAYLADAFNKMILRLNTSNKLRQNLFSDVAHELRTPLAILRSNLEGIQLGVIEATPERIALLNDEILRLSSLVRELQEVGLAEAGELHLNLKTEDLGTILEDLQQIFALEAESRDIRLVFSYPKVKLFVDRDRLRQILINIISNALRFAEGGTISLNVKELDDFYEFRVANTGELIPLEDIEHIFDRFYKTDTARTRGKSGSGLGLSIAKAYVEAHQGSIFVKNLVNETKGVEFIFTIKKLSGYNHTY